MPTLTPWRERKRELSPLLYKDTNPIRLGPTLMTSYNLNYLYLPNTVTLGIKASIYEFGGIQIFSPYQPLPWNAIVLILIGFVSKNLDHVKSCLSHFIYRTRKQIISLLHGICYLSRSEFIIEFLLYIDTKFGKLLISKKMTKTHVYIAFILYWGGRQWIGQNIEYSRYY